ncbi:MAG TPA: hypothetical protein VG166_09205 [Caulobacteraceae bacterium]|nr:hypothetical protein [Caulobacteraceae bacterium]
MSGVLDVLLDCGGVAVSSGTISGLAFTSIFDRSASAGVTNSQTISGIGGPGSLGLVITGPAVIKYVRNGVGPTAVTGNIPVASGDRLYFLVDNTDTVSGAGTVTLSDAAAMVTVDTFTWKLGGYGL